MKKIDKAICKWYRCQKEYDRDEVARRYGKDSNVYLLGYCSAYCFTRDTVKGVDE